MQRTSIKPMLLRLVAVPTVGLIAIYGADAAAPLVGKGRAHLAVAPAAACPTSEQVVAEHGRDRLFGDGGFRNHAYTSTAPGFLQVIADTLCLNRHAYRDEEGLTRISPVPTATYALNKNGRRGRDWDATSSSSVRVFLLGGSTAFSWMADEASSIHTLLEQQLNQRSAGTQYEVFNAATPGATAADELNIFEDEVVARRPDIAVFLTGINNAGRGENDYSLLRGPDRRRQAMASRALLRFRLRNVHHLFTFPQPVRAESRDAFTTIEAAANLVCRNAGIRCIFALQPTLLVERHPFSDGERAVRDAVFTYEKNVNPENYETDYALFDQTFASWRGEYLDLRNLGAKGLWAGWIKPAAAYEFEKSPHRSAVHITHKTGAIERFSVRIQDHVLAARRCAAASLKLTTGGEYSVRCSVSGFPAMKELIADATSTEGYEKVVVSGGDGSVILKLPADSTAESIEVEVLLKNYRNRDDMRLDASLSIDGGRFGAVESSTRPYPDGAFRLRWTLAAGRGSEAVFVKLKYPSDGYIGLASVSYDVRGTVPTVDLAGSFQISNLGSDRVLALQGHRESPPHVFVDAAHLTPGGNAIAAELIARKILGSP